MNMVEKERKKDTKTDSGIPAEYMVGTTKYIVNSVFDESRQKESLEAKVQRLILQDKQNNVGG